jgi:hypothetical protein
MKTVNISTRFINSEKDQIKVDEAINAETERKLNEVPQARDFNVMTACIIDNEFVLVSEYDISEELYMTLERA